MFVIKPGPLERMDGCQNWRWNYSEGIRSCIPVDIVVSVDKRVEEKAEKISRLEDRDGMNLGNEESASNVSSSRGCNQRI